MVPSPAYRSISHQPIQLDDDEARSSAMAFHQLMEQRRSVRDFSDRPIDEELIDMLIRTASTAPSGAHKQPWTFCVVTDAGLKRAIRAAAEAEEYESYNGRMSTEWLEDLAPIGTDWHKPFLETAPCLIVVFKRAYELKADGSKRKNYYVEESTGIACGILLAAAQNAGLVTLTHTPSPMNFLTEILQRPENERPFLLIPIGHAAEHCAVPDLKRKDLEEVRVRYA
ncbi:MAG: nitroreductase family protein [Flavobacteriales bacterium]